MKIEGSIALVTGANRGICKAIAEELLKRGAVKAAGLDGDKIPPQTVATSALDALESGQAEALVDELTRGVKSALHDDHNLLYPALEQEFAATAAS